MGELQPLLSGGRTAEWVTVSQELISWVKSVRKGRRVFRESFDGTSVPCEQGCGKSKGIGESVLVMHFNGEQAESGQTKRDRVFCSVQCQRQNYFENPGRFKIRKRH